jgi:hypothetical protein
MPSDRLDWHGCVAAVRELEGRPVAVRIVRRRGTEELVAVFHARLGALSGTAKQPSLFWPLGTDGAHAEQPGIYLREENFVRAERRPGGIVVVDQSEVVMNLRPLDERTDA